MKSRYHNWYSSLRGRAAPNKAHTSLDFMPEFPRATGLFHPIDASWCRFIIHNDMILNYCTQKNVGRLVGYNNMYQYISCVLDCGHWHCGHQKLSRCILLGDALIVCLTGETIRSPWDSEYIISHRSNRSRSGHYGHQRLKKWEYAVSTMHYSERKCEWLILVCRNE
jgi:hypothetical protein